MSFILDEIMFMDQFDNSITMPKCLTNFSFFWAKFHYFATKKEDMNIPKIYILFSMNYSQIWLTPLVDDCQSTYAH
jgi:hypothetical protein